MIIIFNEDKRELKNVVLTVGKVVDSFMFSYQTISEDNASCYFYPYQLPKEKVMKISRGGRLLDFMDCSRYIRHKG